MCFYFEGSSDLTALKFNVTIPYLQPDLLCSLKSVFAGPYIQKFTPLISDFHYNNLIASLFYNRQHSKVLSESSLCDFEFISQSLNQKSFSSLFIIFYNSPIITSVIFFITIFLMQKVSNMDFSFINAFCTIIFKDEQVTIKTKKPSIISYFWFTNMYNFILSKSYWIYNYIQDLYSNKLHITIISKVYKNIKHLISKYKHNYNLNKIKVFTANKYLIHVPYTVMLSSSNLNKMYASLTVLYIFLGWLIDYLSFIWIYSNKKMQFKFIGTIGFWVRHFIYAMLYISWLFIGVFSTNGLYFLILNNITSVDNFNILIFVLGSVFTYVFSNLWFLYGLAINKQQINIVRFFKDICMLPIILFENFYTDIYIAITELYSRFIEIVILPINFNYYSTLRRSILEWLAFSAMVFSTYGSWNLYIIHVFYNITVIQNFFIWLVSSFFSGYLLIYIEEIRPIYSNFYYGLLYLLFWTSICFSTNSIVIGFFNTYNALYGLYYFLPVNFLLAFTYSLPFYRINTNLSLFSRLLHLIFFITLVGITLLSAGLLWYIIGPM